MSPVAVSVIISNMNGMAFLPRLIETLKNQRNVDVQIIVVERSSNDGSAEYLASLADVAVVNEPPESGLVSGYAAGVALARHDHLFFCNEDMWLDSDCLRLLEERIDLDAGVVAADPWQWTYDGGTLIHAGTRFAPALLNFLCPYPFTRYLFTESPGNGDVVPFPCAGAFMMHRKAYEETGGWDTSFFLDHEDVDLFVRVWQAGHRCVSVPRARVYHAVGASNQQRIPASNTPVKRRRVVSGQASVAIIGMKYFTGWARAYAYAFPILCIVKDMMRLRLRNTWLGILAAMEVCRRSGAAGRYRASHEIVNKLRPGQHFFTDQRFRVSA